MRIMIKCGMSHLNMKGKKRSKIMLSLNYAVRSL